MLGFDAGILKQYQYRNICSNAFAKFPQMDKRKHVDEWLVLVCTCICLAGSGLARKYDMQELCATQQGSARISLEQGSYVQLDLELPVESVATEDADDGVRCEMVVQTTHKDDGLLFYFENFDFVGSNFATVYRRAPPLQPECGATLVRVYDGEFHYLDSCVGPGLRRAPPVTTYSALGAVRLQLLPASSVGGAVGAGDSNAQGGKERQGARPIKFTIIATASQKAVVTDECASGCCREPYTFRCPLLDYCIDRKLTCNNVTNCGPRVGYPQDENGELCSERHVNSGGGVLRLLGPSDVQRVVPVEASTSSDSNGQSAEQQRTNMLRPLWANGEAGDALGTFGIQSDTSGGIGGAGSSSSDVPQAFYTRIELVCGIVSIALFCLAGIGVLVCRFRGLPSRSWRRTERPTSGDNHHHHHHHQSTSGRQHSDDSDDAEDSTRGGRAQSAAAAARLAETLAASPPPLYDTVVGSGGASLVPKPTCRAPSAQNGAAHNNYAAVYTIELDPSTSGSGSGHQVELPPPKYETLYPKIE